MARQGFVSNGFNSGLKMRDRNSSLTCLFLFLVSVLSLLAAVRPVQAQGDSCEADRSKFCPMYRADNPRRFYCLKGIEDQLKPACRSMLRDISGTEGDFIYECGDDYRALCSNVPAGQGRILKCLEANSKKLNFECRKKIVAFPGKR